MPKNVTADPEAEATASADQPAKRTKTLRLSLKSAKPDDEIAAQEPAAAPAEVTPQEEPIPAAAAETVVVVEEGPVLSPAERREAILRKLREAGDPPPPVRNDTGKDGAPPAFRYPVNRFARST